MRSGLWPNPLLRLASPKPSDSGSLTVSKVWSMNPAREQKVNFFLDVLLVIDLLIRPAGQRTTRPAGVGFRCRL